MELSPNQVKGNGITNLSGHHLPAHCSVHLLYTRNDCRLQTERLGLRFRETK